MQCRFERSAARGGVGPGKGPPARNSPRPPAPTLGAAITFQILVLVGMVVSAAMPLWTGTEIRVKTVPVDPRSVFRGNYALLRYDFSNLPPSGLGIIEDARQGEVLYVRLERGEEGEHEYAGVSLERPSDGIFLRGRIADFHPTYRVRFGIEAFLAPKDKALALERDLGEGGIAVLMVAGDGRAAIKEVFPNVKPDAETDPDS